MNQILEETQVEKQTQSKKKKKNHKSEVLGQSEREENTKQKIGKQKVGNQESNRKKADNQESNRQKSGNRKSASIKAGTQKTDNAIFDFFVQVLRGCMFFFVGMFLIAPIVGTICAFLDISFTFFIWSVIVILSAVFAVFLIKTDLFVMTGVRDLLSYGVIFIVSAAIYMNFSPVLELRQDPSLYMFKTMNLINYGKVYKPMNTYDEMIKDGVFEGIHEFTGIEEDTMDNVYEYAGVQNGTQLKDGNLHTDFYPGGTYFYAMFGMLSKRMAFYGQTVMMMMNALLLYELIQLLTKKRHNISNVVCTIVFIIAPIIVWFGRGSFSEPSALLYILFLALLFADREKVPVSIISFTILSLYSARIDYVLIMFIAVVLLTYISMKWAAITTAVGCLEIYIFSKTYWIYYDRITKNDMKILKFSIPMLLMGLAVGILIQKLWKEFSEFYRSYLVTFILIAIGIGLSVLAFWDNNVSEYQMDEIHEVYMRTYVEDVFDMLFMVFPSFIIVAGILGLYKIQRNEEIDFIPNAFLVGIFAAYSYFFISFGNSPQLYWGLRRYYNVLLPVLFLSFVLLIKDMDEHVKLVISVACLVISANMFFDSEQIPDYKKLDISAQDFQVKLDTQNIEYVFYEEDLKYNISSAMSYCRQEFIPVSMADIENVSKWLKEKGKENYIFLSQNDYGNSNDIYNISYKKMGENYGSVPQDVYKKSFDFYTYQFDALTEEYGNIKAVIYSKERKLKSGVIYEDGWMGSGIVVDNLHIKSSPDSRLIIKRLGCSDYFLDNDLREETGLKIIINDRTVIDEYEIDNENIIFSLEGIKLIDKIEIAANTFSPAVVYDSDDTREISLDVKLIYISEED